MYKGEIVRSCEEKSRTSWSERFIWFDVQICESSLVSNSKRTLRKSTKIPFLNGPFSPRLIVPFPRVFSRSKFAVFNPLADKFEKRREQLFRETTARFSHLVVYFGPGRGSTNFLPELTSVICSQIIRRGWRPRRYFAWKSNFSFFVNETTSPLPKTYFLYYNSVNLYAYIANRKRQECTECV